MKRIKFYERTIFETHGPNHPENPVFEKDAIEEMRDDQAERWLKRKKAELVADLGPDDDTPVVAGIPKAKVQELREQIQQRDEKQTGVMADTLDKGAAKLKQAMKDDDRASKK